MRDCVETLYEYHHARPCLCMCAINMQDNTELWDPLAPVHAKLRFSKGTTIMDVSYKYGAHKGTTPGVSIRYHCVSPFSRISTIRINS